MAAPIAGLVVSTVMEGIFGFLAGSGRSKAQIAQAQQLKNNVAAIQSEIERGELEMNEALVRIDDLIDNTKGELKGVMENQVNLATKQIKDQYREGLRTTMQNIKQELGGRRLFGSEAGQAVRRKTAVGLQEQAGETVSNLRQKALNDIAAQMAQLNLKGGLLKESKREKQQQFRLGAIGEIMQLQNMAGTLETTAPSPFLEAFKGAVTGGGAELLGKAFTPGPELKEAPTGAAIPPIQEPKSFLK